MLANPTRLAKQPQPPPTGTSGSAVLKRHTDTTGYGRAAGREAVVVAVESPEQAKAARAGWSRAAAERHRDLPVTLQEYRFGQFAISIAWQPNSRRR
jgi:hypothetical protein